MLWLFDDTIAQNCEVTSAYKNNLFIHNCVMIIVHLMLNTLTKDAIFCVSIIFH